jgi:hypothetical protein
VPAVEGKSAKLRLCDADGSRFELAQVGGDSEALLVPVLRGGTVVYDAPLRRTDVPP